MSVLTHSKMTERVEKCNLPWVVKWNISNGLRRQTSAANIPTHVQIGIFEIRIDEGQQFRADFGEDFFSSVLHSRQECISRAICKKDHVTSADVLKQEGNGPWDSRAMVMISPGTKFGIILKINLQGWTLWCALGSVNKRWKSCVLLPAAGRRTQYFLLIFTEPGAHH